MANPNINVWGATYNGVTGVTLPTSGGGTATFPWVEGSETKTQNGTYDVSHLAQLIVNVSGGGGSGLVYETGTYTPTADIARPEITWTNSHTESPVFVGVSDVSSASGITANSNILFVYFDPWKAFGAGYPYSTSATRYSVAYYTYKTSSSVSSAGTTMSHSSDETGTNANYSQYWASPTDFHPYSNSTSRYWRNGRTYKWIAVWKPTS